MAVLEDLKNEIENYPHTFLDLEVVEVDPAVGAAINRGEEVSFRIRVTNRGGLDVHGLDLVVTGLNGTLVKSNGAAAQFGSTFSTGSGWFPDLPAHQPLNPVTSGGNKFVFKATSASQTAQDLVRVEVGNWDTDLEHFLIHHSDPDAAAQVTFSSTVARQ